MAIEHKEKNVSRIYATVIPNLGSKFFKSYFECQVCNDTHIKTDRWRRYDPLRKNDISITQIPTGKKRHNFPNIHHAIMMLKSWLRGTHHPVKNLWDYLNEYTYSFNRSNIKGVFRT